MTELFQSLTASLCQTQDSNQTLDSNVLYVPCGSTGLSCFVVQITHPCLSAFQVLKHRLWGQKIGS